MSLDRIEAKLDRIIELLEQQPKPMVYNIDQKISNAASEAFRRAVKAAGTDARR